MRVRRKSQEVAELLTHVYFSALSNPQQKRVHHVSQFKFRLHSMRVCVLERARESIAEYTTLFLQLQLSLIAQRDTNSRLVVTRHK